MPLSPGPGALLVIHRGPTPGIRPGRPILLILFLLLNVLFFLLFLIIERHLLAP